jgi:hypothetical protein
MENENYWDNVDTQSLKDFFCPGNVVERPPINANHLRLYSNSLCPYAEKAKLALTA